MATVGKRHLHKTTGEYKMPLLQTDIAAGAKATAEQQLLPTQVEEKLKQLPMETQRLQQQLQKGTQDLQKGERDMQAADIKFKEDTIKLQQLVTGVEQDRDTREASAKYFADPLNIAKPMHQQMQELGQIVAGKGNLKMAEKMFDDSGKALERQERAARLRDEHDEKQLEKLRMWVGGMTPENADTVVMDMMQNKDVDPKLAAMIKAGADRTKGDPKAFEAFKDMLKKDVGSIEGKKQRETERKNDMTHQERVADNKRITENATMANNRLVAASARADRAQLDRAAATSFTENQKAANHYRGLLSDLNRTQIARAKILKEPEPSTSWFGSESEKRQNWEDARDEEKQNAVKEKLEKVRLQTALEEAEKGMTVARTLASEEYKKLLKDSPRASPAPKNTEEKAPEKGAQSSTKDAEALAWADANPDDPRAAAIRKKASGAAQAPAKAAPAQEVPKKQSNARDETFARGDKFNDPELNRFKLLSQSARGNVSINAYVDYVARLKKLEAK